MKINKIYIVLAIFFAVLTSCKNKENEFSDFKYQTVYFANQYPIRTIELGEDLFIDNTLDNQHKFKINATMGGVYDNNTDIVIDYVMDSTLCRGAYFNEGPTLGQKVIPMPVEYYSIASNKITIPSRSLLGGVEVQLTDAFFADPKSITNTYVIPLLMTKVQGADSILQGLPVIGNPNRIVGSDWVLAPRDYVFYCVKFVNPWHGNYLRRGKDVITKADGTDSISVRHATYVEQNPVVSAITASMTTDNLPLSITYLKKLYNFSLVLTFDNDGTCSVSSSDANIDIAGIGKFVSKGDKNSIGGKDRDALYLDYTVNFKTLNVKCVTKDTLTMRDRGVKPDYYSVIKK